MLEVPRILAASRLVSLTGAGGVGKTRLAVRVAAGLVDEFADGVWIVDLSPLTVPDLLPQTVATTLAIREGGQRSARDVLLDALRDRRLVLVLDTCEHLIESCASLADEHPAPGAVGANPGDDPRSARRAKGRRSIESGRWPCRIVHAQTAYPPSRMPLAFSSIEHERSIRISGTPVTTRMQSSVFVAVSTAFHWRSSWRPPV